MVGLRQPATSETFDGVRYLVFDMEGSVGPWKLSLTAVNGRNPWL